MPSIMQRAAPVNQLLDALPPADKRRVLAGCETVQLAFADVLYTPGDPLRHVYFPTHGFISLLMPVGVSGSLEVGLVGDEGMFGIPLALGVDTSPVRAVVEGAGRSLRMGSAVFRRELQRAPALHGAVNRYAHVHMTQLAQGATCTRFHVVEARLARWLLMTQDRAHADEFEATQARLALILGVRRGGITRAASAMQDRGLIRYRRGHVTVLNRRGLKAASCGCYKADRDVYTRMLASPAERPG